MTPGNIDQAPQSQHFAPALGGTPAIRCLERSSFWYPDLWGTQEAPMRNSASRPLHSWLLMTWKDKSQSVLPRPVLLIQTPNTPTRRRKVDMIPRLLELEENIISLLSAVSYLYKSLGSGKPDTVLVRRAGWTTRKRTTSHKWHTCFLGLVLVQFHSLRIAAHNND